MSTQLRGFRLEHSDGRVVGYGAEFPSGVCYVEWNREAWPEGERLSHGHQSRYGHVEDVRTATNAEVVFTGKLTLC